MRKFFLIITFVFLNFQNLKPIKEENVKWVTVVTGLSVGTVASLITHEDAKFWKSFFWGSAIGGLAAYLAYKIALDNTPIGKFNNARDIVNNTHLKYIVVNEFETEQLFLGYIISNYYSNWPLVDARQDLDSIKLNLISAKFLLDSACKETIEYNKDLWICRESVFLKKQIDEFLEKITLRLGSIVSCMLYKEQYKRYKKYQKKVKKLTNTVAKEISSHVQKECEQNRKEALINDIVNKTNGNIGINITI